MAVSPVIAISKYGDEALLVPSRPSSKEWSAQAVDHTSTPLPISVVSSVCSPSRFALVAVAQTTFVRHINIVLNAAMRFSDQQDYLYVGLFDITLGSKSDFQRSAGTNIKQSALCP